MIKDLELNVNNMDNRVFHKISVQNFVYFS